MNLKLPLWLIACNLSIFMLFPLVHAEDNTESGNDLPNPLPLSKAISFAKTHPRLQLSTEKNLTFTHQQPLYLNCHNLAYNGLNTVNSLRTTSLSQLVSPENLQQLHIMQSFLDVHLSDLVLMADNEQMSSAFIQFDRATNRMELKQLSELVVAEKEARYYVELQRFRSTGATQRMTRSTLAQELGILDKIPSDVIPMQAWKIPQELPEFSDLLNSISKNNQWLNKHKSTLKVPEKKLINLQIQQLTNELLLQLETLNAAYQRFEKAANYRDLKLEQSRTLYEQEVKSDLGDSMGQQTRVFFQNQQITYCLNTTWAQLNILQGKPLLEKPPETMKEPSS